MRLWRQSARCWYWQEGTKYQVIAKNANRERDHNPEQATHIAPLVKVTTDAKEAKARALKNDTECRAEQRR
ncbi:hypothetical protein GCM10008066_01560 [Oxalicibacterium faecigallinarum]|uniref:Uncharacterized protein n=1 Tax=Oxalicibacterium faecigallinarum TaxID=573741 RepID=A0A8J3AK57_9BURK|nr:hypothetical protein GCM10008066_01560 [Oxalicibacterium faecigallinarum]